MSCDLEKFTFDTTIFVFKGCLAGEFEEEKHNLRHLQQLQTGTSPWRYTFYLRRQNGT